MFSGIVEGRARIVEALPASGGLRLRIDLGGIAEGVAPGSSVAVDGCCLTVETIERTVATFHAAPETLSLTTLGGLGAGAVVNVERALRIGDALGGHFVTGHVEGVGVIARRTDLAAETQVAFRVPRSLSRNMIRKGSVAVDGVSLTITAVSPGAFSVMLIPHTLLVTGLSDKREGHRVNIETDMLGHYARGRAGGRALLRRARALL